MRFAAVLRVLPEGGSVRSSEGDLEISAANSVTILFSNATGFKNYRDISGDAFGAARAYLQSASTHSYDSLRNRHVDDFRPLFSRVQLSLGEEYSTESTNQRIKNFAQTEDPTLLALYFESGRSSLALSRSA
jgi:alpha-L-fucosidase 2